MSDEIVQATSLFYPQQEDLPTNSTGEVPPEAARTSSMEALRFPPKEQSAEVVESRNLAQPEDLKEALKIRLKKKIELQRRRLEVMKEHEQVMKEKTMLMEQLARHRPGSFIEPTRPKLFQALGSEVDQKSKFTEGQPDPKLKKPTARPATQNQFVSKYDSVLDREEILESHPAYYHPLIVPQGPLDASMKTPREDFLKLLKSPTLISEIFDKMISRPIPAEVGSLQFTLDRKKVGLLASSNNYMLRFANTDVVLLVAKKQSMFKQESNYHIQKTGFYQEQVAKLRGNFLGTEFNLYSKGQNPKEASNSDAVRKQEGFVRYSKDVTGKAPRKFEVGLPMVGRDEKRTREWPDSQNNHERLPFALDRKSSDVIALRNKEPKWNEEKKQHQLDFTERITKTSAKNFVLVDSFDDRKHYMQFGKTTKTNEFALDCAFPMSILQAFGVAISALDLKLGCA